MHRDAYVAIADPLRRDILTLLMKRDTASAGEIADQFNEVSRPAVSRHLRVLRECGVVVSVKQGKARNYVLNPDPINAIRQGWLKEFANRQVSSLKTLRDIVETEP